MTLNLFDDVSLIAHIDRTETNRSGSLSLIGHVPGKKLSRVTFVVNKGIVVGNISTLDRAFQVRYLPGGLQAVHEVNTMRYPDDLDPLVPDLPPAEDKKQARDALAQGDDGSVVELLVVYSDDARAAAGGTTSIEALIDLGITETNQSHTNSGITHVVQVVNKAEVAYDESTFSFTGALNDVTGTTDGVIDNVHTLRDTFGADLVSFWVEDALRTSCGIAWLMTSVSNSFKVNGFSVVGRTCATGNFSFGHEIGHNMAAQHDRSQTPVPSDFTFNHGYTDIPNGFRTIMGRVASCSSCTRIQYWSNPNVNDPTSGAPTGVVDTDPAAADNHQTLNSTALTTANFRTSVTASVTITAGPTGTPNPVASGSAANLSVTATTTGGTLAYSWSASCSTLGSNGSFSSATAQNPAWTAPTNTTGSTQSCTISVTASNGLGQTASGSYTQMVSTSSGSVSITSAPSGTPNPVDSGMAVNLGVTATATGGTLAYAWSDSCPNLGSGGSFSSTTAQNPTWTAPTNTTGVLQDCTISVTVDNGLGASDSGSFTQMVNFQVFTTAQLGSFSNSKKVISPFWQSNTASYTFLAVSHPSLAGMNSQIGLTLHAVANDGLILFGHPLEFTINAGNTQKVFIAPFGHPATTLPGALFITGSSADTRGNMVINPVATLPNALAGTSNSAGRGFPDVTMLSFWGAIIIQNTTTGFAMEFIGDNQNSRAFNTPLFSGLGG